MATQSVDYKTSILETDGLDTGEKEAAAVKPVINGEPGDAVVFNRPTENLRSRTEIARTELEDLKFLSDADRILALTSDGQLTWAIDPGSDLGVLSLATGKNLFLQPFLRVSSNTPALAPYSDDATHRVIFSTVLEPTVGPPACLHPPRSYNGANKLTLEIETVNVDATRVPVVTVTGTPARHIKVSNVNVHSTAGITCADFVSAMQLDPTLMAMGVTAALGPSGQGALIMQDAAVKFVNFAGAAEAELHKITDGGLAAFFAEAGDVNKMDDGDVLAIMYDALVEDTYGGRRQSLTSKPESTYAPDPSPVDRTDCSANLFLTRNHPEWIPLAIPIGVRVGSELLLINGKVYADGSTDYPYPGDFNSTQKAALLAGIGVPAAVPNNVDATTASATGASDVFAKQDHTHLATTGAAVTVDATTTNGVGSGAALARANHTHTLTTGTAVSIGGDSTNSAGSGAALARANHTHDIATGVTSATQAPDNTSAEGTGDNLARASHQHAFPMAVDGDIANVGAAAASAGSANKFVRADHIHKVNFSLTNPAAIGTAAPGAAETPARSDHVHPIGTGTVDNNALASNAVTDIKVDASAAIAGTKLAYAGGGNWYDGTPNPATSVEAQLDKIVTDLASGTGGAKKVGTPAITGHTTFNLDEGSVWAQLSNLLLYVNSVAAATADYPNVVMNGQMAIAQRGTSFSSAGSSARKFGLDRWYFYDAGASAARVVVSQEALGDFVSTRLAMKVKRPNGDSDTNSKYIVQEIDRDMVQQIQGRTVAFQFLSLVGSSWSSLWTIEASVYTGTGTPDETYKGGYTGSSQDLTLSYTQTYGGINNSYQPKRVTGTIPQGATTCAVVFKLTWTGTTSTENAWIAFTEVMLSAFTVDAPRAFQLSSGSPLDEYRACQHYYETSYGPGEYIGSGSINNEERIYIPDENGVAVVPNGYIWRRNVMFTAPKCRYSTLGSPVTVYNGAGSAGAGTLVNTSAAVEGVGLNVSIVTDRHFVVTQNGASGGLNNNNIFVRFHWVADYEI